MRSAQWFTLLTGSALAIAGCSSGADIGDRALFGFTADIAGLSSANTATCSSDITVQSATVELIEQGTLGGDETRAWQAATPFYTDTDTNGGSSYGRFREEVCFYLPEPFNGTVEIPVSTDQAYADFLTITKTFPVVDAGDPLPATLTFTGDGTTGHGSASRQCFNIEAISDVDITAESLQIALGEITTGDDEAFYTGKDPCDVSVAVEDDDGPGTRVSNISNIMEEPGSGGTTSGTFRIRLRTAPTGNVTMSINDLFDSTNAGRREGVATPTSLTFTTGNFATEQIITVNSVDDLEVDGSKTYTIAVENTSSTDPDYNNLNPRDVVIINNDQSVPGYTYVRFDTTGDSTTAGAAGTITGFATDEMNNFGSNYSRFTLSLRSKPDSNVTLNFATSDATISNLITTSLTFTTTNWNVPQTVFVEGRSDGADNGSTNGNQDYTISFTVTTTDPTYSTIPRPSFSIRSCDNDNTHLLQLCNFSGSPIGNSGNRFTASENTTEATTNIWVISKNNPGGTTTVGLTSTDTTEGTVPASVTVDASNYATMTAGGSNQIVMTHKDELLLDGNQNWTVTTATSSGTIVYNTADVFATTNDNEALYYFSVSGSTAEGSPGTTALMHLCLGSNNPDPVQVDAACNGDECGTINGGATGSVTFPTGTAIAAAIPSNAACATDVNRQTFTMTGADDTFADGTQTFSITTTLGNTPLAPYAGTNPPDSGNINNADNESPGKAIFVTSATQSGEMTASGVRGGDTICQTARPSYAPSGTYKAMLVSNSGGEVNDRVATTNGTDATGQTDWVLTANNYYYRCDGSGYTNCSDEHRRLFIANPVALISFPMDRYFSSNGAHTMWTGMNVNMTPATQTSTPAATGTDPAYRHNCAGFTFETAPESPNPEYFANTWSDGGGGTVTSNTNVGCQSSPQRIICVQQ
ncbi:MAG: DUF1554 domain-containing protein [bacterium]|nr:DUF1554 domain-containing protein [bacterium]